MNNPIKRSADCISPTVDKNNRDKKKPRLEDEIQKVASESLPSSPLSLEPAAYSHSEMKELLQEKPWEECYDLLVLEGQTHEIKLLLVSVLLERASTSIEESPFFEIA